MIHPAPQPLISSPYDFVGYWGYGDRTRLDRCLPDQPGWPNTRSVSIEQPPQEKAFSRVWNVRYLSSSRQISFDASLQPSVPSDDTAQASGKTLTLVSRSVTGLSQADAWVILSGRKMGEHLTLGREAFGRSPLYWMQQGQVIWFASRIQLLLPLMDQPQVSTAGLYGYSCFSYVPTPLTPVEGIVAIAAGTEQTWSSHAGHILATPTQTCHFWQEKPQQQSLETEAIAQLQTLLQGAIDCQLSGCFDQPVGVLLSGGLDSSIVAALLVRAGVQVRGYTLDLGAAGISEYPYAEQVAHHLKIPLVKVAATPQQIRRALNATVKALDLPFGDGVTVPLFLLSQAASQEVAVIFNGEGGDQLFAGWTNKPLIAASIYQAQHPKEPYSFLQQYLHTFHRLWGYEAQVFAPSLYAQVRSLSAEDWIAEALDPTPAPSLLHRLRRATLLLKGAQNIHPRATNLALAHGLQVRSPFCDMPLADWTFGLAGSLCLQGACEKYILKRAVEDWLPTEIVWRPKRGMGVPLTSWCLQDWWHTLGDWLNPEVLRTEQRWQPHLATQIVNGQLGGLIQGRRIGEILWLLVMWQLWRSQVLGESLGARTWDHPFWLPRSLWSFSRTWQV